MCDDVQFACRRAHEVPDAPCQRHNLLAVLRALAVGSWFLHDHVVGELLEFVAPGVSCLELLARLRADELRAKFLHLRLDELGHGQGDGVVLD